MRFSELRLLLVDGSFLVCLAPLPREFTLLSCQSASEGKIYMSHRLSVACLSAKFELKRAKNDKGAVKS